MRLWKYYSFPSSPLKRIIIQNFILVNPRLSLDAVRVVGFIKTTNFVLAQVAHPPDSLVSNKPEKLHNQAEPGRCSRCRFYQNRKFRSRAGRSSSGLARLKQARRITAEPGRRPRCRFIKTSVCAVLLQVQPVPPLLQSWQLLRRCPRRCSGLA